MDDRELKTCLAVSIGAAASLGLWWLLRGKVESSRDAVQPADLELYQRPVARVTQLNLYPVKSCHRIEVDSIECFARGFAYDRAFVFVNNEGHFICQRRYPTLARVQPRIEKAGTGSGRRIVLHLTAPGMPELTVQEPPAATSAKMIRIRRSSGEGVDVGDEAARWISTYLKVEGCRMFYMSPSHRPRVLLEDAWCKDISQPGEEISFSDCSPLLVISEASLEDLNSKLDSPVPMERFRPNIVISGCGAHEEDSWDQMRIGNNVLIRHLKPCGRCKMTTVDQEKGHFTGNEPLVTLRKYRLHENLYNCPPQERYGNSPLFGVNCTVISYGDVHVGDTVFTQ